MAKDAFGNYEADLRPQDSPSNSVSAGSDLPVGPPCSGADQFGNYQACPHGGGVVIPGTPILNSALADVNNDVTLEWGWLPPAPQTETYSEVWTSVDGVSFALAATVAGTTATAIIHQATQNVYYKVRACNASGCSGFSEASLVHI